MSDAHEKCNVRLPAGLVGIARDTQDLANLADAVCRILLQRPCRLLLVPAAGLGRLTMSAVTRSRA